MAKNLPDEAAPTKQFLGLPAVWDEASVKDELWSIQCASAELASRTYSLLSHIVIPYYARAKDAVRVRRRAAVKIAALLDEVAKVKTTVF